MADISKLKIPKPEPVDVTNLPKELPDIQVDYAKCTVPMWCKKCLKSCPQLVFATYCKQFVKMKESDPREPGVYELLPVRRDKCTMCGQCVDICPEGALTITHKGKVLKGSAKGPSTVAEAKKSSYPLHITPKSYSFDLNETMLTALREEFDPEKIVNIFAKAVSGKSKTEADSIGKKIFGEYGKNWMKKVIQLGEEYSDMTYETLKGAIDHTGELLFPLVPQRFIEIAYLSTQPFLKLPVVENYAQLLVYQVPDCATLKLIKSKCAPAVADLQPCQYACLSALETLFASLNLNTTIKRNGTTQEQNYCEYSIKHF